jgi:hypothetical protein
MTTLPPRHRWPLLLAGVFAVGFFLTLVARFWHPVYGFTALIQLDASNDNVKLNAYRELPVYVHRHNGGYDGLYYAQLALDPSLRDPQLRGAIDNFAYRARRILPPAVAWVLGAGQPAWIVQIYSLLNVAAWLTLAALLWRLLAVDNARGLLAWAGVLFSAGALASVRLALTDLIALVILAGALWAAEDHRKKMALAGIAAAALARETSLLACAGLLKSPWLSQKNLLRALVVIAPLAAWLAYVRWRVGPADQGWSNLTIPGAGIVEKWREVVGATQTLSDKLLAWTTVLATLGLTVQAVFIVARPRLDDRWWRVGAAYVGLMLVLGRAVWEDFPGAAMRVLLPLTLVFNVIAHRVRAPIAWLVLGNLGVFAGLIAWRDSPFAGQELAAAKAGDVAAIVRPGEGWFPLEQHGRQTWQWTSERGTIEIETWPRGRPVSVQLDFELRSPVPRAIVIRQDGRELWRTDVGAALSPYHLNLQVGPNQSTIEFATDTAGVPESPAPNARALAFALYNAHVSVREK